MCLILFVIAFKKSVTECPWDRRWYADQWHTSVSAGTVHRVCISGFGRNYLLCRIATGYVLSYAVLKFFL